MDKLWTIAEAAAYLQLPESEIERLTRAGRLTVYTLAGEFQRFQPQQVKELKTQLGDRLPAPAAERSADEAGIAWLLDWLYRWDLYLVAGGLLVLLISYFLVVS